MMRLLPGLLAFTLAAVAGAAPDPAPAEKDTERVLRLTTELETEPHGAGAAEARRWLTQWAEQTPDYEVKVCDILGPIPGRRVPNGTALLGQMIFGNVSFQIRQGRNSDELSRQVAGFQSLLRAYAVMLNADPSARIAYMDAFLEAERRGELRAKLAPVLVAKACE